MRKRMGTGLAALAVCGIVLGQAGAAQAVSITGNKYCSAPRDAYTTTTSGSGAVSHAHLDHNDGDYDAKTFTNTTTTTRTWGTGFEDIFFRLSGPITSYGASCLT